MTHITELRKDPRPATTETQPPYSRQVPSTHIPSHILKVLGLKSAEPRPEEI
jgi:hypothetical protein